MGDRRGGHGTAWSARTALASARTGVRSSLRDQVVRRLAFLLELVERPMRGRAGEAVLRSSGALPIEDCTLLTVVAHWRGPSQRPAAPADEPLLACLDELLALPVRRHEIVVVSDEPEGALDLVRGHLTDDTDVRIGRWTALSSSVRSIRIEPWVARWPRRHGFYLTWHHKAVFRRALADGDFTHLLYLEDDIRFTTENLRYWLGTRAALAEHGLLPGFVRYERFAGERYLVDQTRSGQHAPLAASSRLGLPTVDGVADGVEVRRSLRPYQAGYLLDRDLAEHHLRRSALRSPLRSNVARWDLRERAAAGETFGSTQDLWRALLRPRDARPEIRTAVLVPRGPGATGAPVEGALIEHLRPVYSRDPGSRHGKVPVERF